MADGQKTFREQVIGQFSALTTAAFGLIAALAWNGFITLLFQHLFGTQSSLLPLFLYAVFVTVLAVIMSILIAKAARNALKQGQK
ncbi:MAG: DUF5654 family protein [Candidatus Thermoplasmatota archaeon]|jgi:hypothetical protein|nr:hypothetical protein [Candidatus Sysuiplasma jiujiangense]MBX8639423.1 hypothetical protein [Candidatus Sysuiplasma jiujiangense]MBX8641566.1 hypothetical protein [Candidatus Sysuiplasma jiujiangense]MCL4317631.1 DUF5654 family protein [Candidatus Thermoplasmatota archaeon]